MLTSDVAANQTSCSIDPQQDAVIPAELRVENTSSSFPIKANVAFGLEGSGYQFDILPIELAAGGPGCTQILTDNQEKSGRFSWDSVAPGEKVAQQMLIIMRGYYNEANPVGQPDQVSNLFGSLEFSDNGNYGKVVEFGAPSFICGYYKEGYGGDKGRGAMYSFSLVDRDDRVQEECDAPVVRLESGDLEE